MGVDSGWTREILGLFQASVAVSINARKQCRSDCPDLHHLPVGAKGAECSDVTQQELCAMAGLGVCHTRMGVNKQLCCMAVILQHLWSCISFEFPVEPEPLLAWEG